MKKIILFLSVCTPTMLLGCCPTDFEIAIKKAIKAKDFSALRELEAKDNPPYLNFHTQLKFNDNKGKEKSLFEIATQMHKKSPSQYANLSQSVLEFIVNWNNKGYQYELNTYQKSDRLLWVTMKLYDLHKLSTTEPTTEHRKKLKAFIRNNKKNLTILAATNCTTLQRLDVITRKPCPLETSIVDLLEDIKKPVIRPKYSAKEQEEITQSPLLQEKIQKNFNPLLNNEPSWEEIAKLPTPQKRKYSLVLQMVKRTKLSKESES